jgi:hypothetical protein
VRRGVYRRVVCQGRAEPGQADRPHEKLIDLREKINSRKDPSAPLTPD